MTYVQTLGLRKSGNLRLDASTSELDKEKEKRLLVRFKRDCLDPATGEHYPAREAKLRADGKPFLSKGGYLHTIAEKRLPIHYGGTVASSPRRTVPSAKRRGISPTRSRSASALAVIPTATTLDRDRSGSVTSFSPLVFNSRATRRRPPSFPVQEV